MISVEVRNNNISEAIKNLKRRLMKDASLGEMKVRNFPKRSEREKAKRENAKRRVKRSERRKLQRQQYAERQNKRRAKAA